VDNAAAYGGDSFLIRRVVERKAGANFRLPWQSQ